MARPQSILICAGEVSGDMHAARLLRAVRARRPDADVFGIGGDHMAEEGCEILVHSRDMAVMGFFDVLARLRFFRRTFHALLREAGRRRPSVAVLVDYPGFNLRLAARLHRMGIRVVYFICPQVWAWHRSRIPKMSRIVDRLITIFPFEKKHFSGTGLRVDFVGHPLVAEARAERLRPPDTLPWNGQPHTAILPGSRRRELEHHLPVMLRAAALVRQRMPGASFLIAAPSDEMAAIAQHIAERTAGAPPHWTVVAGQTRQILRQAHAAWVASGTATVECALMECPMVVVYRTGPLTYRICRRLIRVPHIGMVNIVAGKRICPERIQDQAVPEGLAEAILPLLADTPVRQRMIEELRAVGAALGPPGAEVRAAQVILSEMGGETA